MSAAEMLWSIYGELMLAGAMGGVVRWLTMREKLPDGIAGVVIGALASFYLEPGLIRMLAPVVDFSGIDYGGAQRLCGFLIGVGGTIVIQFIFDLWRARSAQLRSTLTNQEQNP